MAMGELYDCAVRAWRRFCAANGYYPDQPASSRSEEITTEDGRGYVALANCHGLLAVYRVYLYGTLRKMKRMPPEIRALYAVTCS
jgi:hypothetical protein